MTRIAGINKAGKQELIKKMLDKLPYKKWKYCKIFSTQHSTFGIVSNHISEIELEKFEKEKLIEQSIFDKHFARAKEIDGTLILERDFPGVAPIYYGYTADGNLAFSSEMKSLKQVTNEIRELKPGNRFQNNQNYMIHKISLPDRFLESDEISIANTLRDLIERNISNCIKGDKVGSWLSGGLDSSIIALVVNKFKPALYTFSGGVRDSPDLKFASIVAEKLKSKHFEITVTIDEVIKELPEVIYALESFDAYLVRSTVINYIITKKASDYVEYVFSGEGGDELFAGYSYLKTLPANELPKELVKIIDALHNTALQRVDRSSMSHGVQAIVPFAIPEIIEYAVKIPPELKIKNGVEKWILRKAFENVLPEKVFQREKAKFWEGSGIKTLIAEYANSKISDIEFQNNCITKSGFKLRTKEEYLYYKIFAELFGDFEDFQWLGFSKIESSEIQNF